MFRSKANRTQTTGTSTSGSSSIPNDIKTKICCLRSTFITSMIASAVICGSITFTTVQQLELDLAEQSYYSVAASVLKGAQAIARRKIKGAEVMASIFSYRFPDSSSWPFVSLPGFVETGVIVSETPSSTITLGVVVRPEQVSEFETFAANFYQQENSTKGAGSSDFGFGIWKNDVTSPYEDRRVHDTSGNTSRGGKYSILVPILQHTNRTSVSLMFNTYSDDTSGPLIDNILDCSNTRNFSDTSTPNCGALSGFLELQSRPGPAAVLRQPIYPINDPTNMVGFAASTFPWEEILKDVVPDYIQGLYCVISTDDESYTFVMNDGVPTLIGKGDLHDASYDKYMTTATIAEDPSLAPTSTKYKLTIYPSHQLLEGTSSGPRAWTIAMGFVAVIIVSTALFFLYDVLMRNEARQQKVILEVKRRFVRFVSHEIRTPLNTVCLGLELLQEDLKVADVKAKEENKETVSNDTGYAPLLRMVDDISENANNAIGILNDLLNYDKMEHGTLNLEVGEVAIWDIVLRTVSSFDIQAKKRSIELTCKMEGPEDNEVDRSNLKTWGDDVRLRQVIRNVVSNSLKFSVEGSGKVHVSLAHNSDGLPNAVLPRSDIVNEATSNILACNFPRAGSIRISVTDNGVGMTPAQLDRLFQEGVQFEPNKLQNGGGSGLGLHITKRLVEQHGGTIEMFSDGQNLGCVVVVELPLYMDSVPARLLSSQNPKMIESPIPPIKTFPKVFRKCLVVDDSLPNRKMLVRLLERAGHTCLSATNGQEAVEIMEADHVAALNDKDYDSIDSILMDYEMPVLNGPNATKILREKGYINVVIIGVTGNVLIDDINFFISAGADKVLPKPVTLSLIEDYWESIVDRQDRLQHIDI